MDQPRQSTTASQPPETPPQPSNSASKPSTLTHIQQPPSTNLSSFSIFSIPSSPTPPSPSLIPNPNPPQYTHPVTSPAKQQHISQPFGATSSAGVLETMATTLLLHSLLLRLVAIVIFLISFGLFFFVFTFYWATKRWHGDWRSSFPNSESFPFTFPAFAFCFLLSPTLLGNNTAD